LDFEINFPFNWLKKLTHKNGKPNYIAIILLAYLNSNEIAPQKYIDGELNPYFDQGGIYFKRETLAKIFKCTKRNISFALKYLEDKKLIERIVDRNSNVIKQNRIEKLQKQLKENKINQKTYEKEKKKIENTQNSVYSKLFIVVNREEVKKLNS